MRGSVSLFRLFLDGPYAVQPGNTAYLSLTDHANFRAVLIAAALCMTPPMARADPAECREAVDRYNEATSEVADALRAYSRCVSDSRGHDDCSSEFSRLRSAQDDFETAVSDFESECQ